MAFSSSMLLADLDYIAPSQACIKPQVMRQAAGTVGIHTGGDTTAALMEEIPVKITLQDCLACSGCVTTAETLLVTSQSRPQIEAVLAGTDDARMQPLLVVVSVSDQSAASLAAHLGITMYDAFHCISGFSRQVMGGTHVTDMRWAQRLTLEETSSEFARRLEGGGEHGPLPMMVSSCPGWICYAEKTQPFLLPYISTVMSPQAVVGRYVKQCFPRLCGPPPGVDASSLTVEDLARRTYHVSIQPCFDRKLEAARGDLAADWGRDTDCVLGTQELLDWMLELDPSCSWRAPLDSAMEPLRPPVPPCIAMKLEGSGGYHQRVIVDTASRVGANHDVASAFESIVYQDKRNQNHRLATLQGVAASATSKPLIFGVVYGFQHVQNLVRGLKRKTAATPDYAFIEVMACPEGCLNGGGQIRVANRAQHYERLAAVMEAFETFSAQASEQPPPDQDAAGWFTSASAYRDWIGDGPGSVAASDMLRTVLHDRQAEMQLQDSVAVSLRW